MSDKTTDENSTYTQTTLAPVISPTKENEHSTKESSAGWVDEYINAPFEDVDVAVETTQTAIVRTDENEEPCAEQEQYDAAVSGDSPLHEKILALAEEHQIDSRVIDLPEIFFFSTTSDGQKFVSDLNNVIQYFPETGFLRTSVEYEQNEQVAYSSERATDMLTIYGQ